MSRLTRSVLAVLAGVMAALIVIMVVQQLSAMIYPPPAGFNPEEPGAFAALIATLPLGAFFMVLLSYLLGALVGGYLAARLAPSRRAVHAGMIAVALLVGTILNLVAAPHPLWFMAANLLLVVVVPFLAARLAEPHAVAAKGEV